MRQIAERTGISKSVIARRIKQTGVSRDRSSSQILGCKRTPQVPYDWSYFPLTAGKAWLIGLIYGDGSLHNAGRTITLTSGDRDVIENVNHLFGGTLGVSMPTPTYWKLHIHSVRLWKELNVAFALVPNKSRVLRYPELSDEMKPHFIRGLLDSDGCWYSDRRNKQPRLGFRYVSLSLEFLQSEMSIREACILWPIPTMMRLESGTGSIRAPLRATVVNVSLSIGLSLSNKSTCPKCGHVRKSRPPGREFRCTNRQCRWSWHRDCVGAYNIRQKYRGEFGGPHVVADMAPATGMRFAPHTRVAREQSRETVCMGNCVGAAGP
jgi:putative transposase-like DNA-binding protein